MEQDRKIELVDKWENTGDERYLEEALQLYKEALEEDPNNPELLFHYGTLHQSKGIHYLRKAAAYFVQGLESNPDRDSWVYNKLNYQLISVRSHLLQINKAVEFYKNKIKEFPDEPRLYCYLAECFLRADQIHEAKKVVNAGLKIDSSHAMLHYCKGSVAAREGNIEHALQSWQRATELDPELIDARFSRAFLLEQQQRLQDCADEWRLIIEWLEMRGWMVDGAKAELQRITEKLKSEN